MQVKPVDQSNSAARAVHSASKPAVSPAKQQVAQKEDTVFLTQKGKDLAASMSGKLLQQEAKEPPTVQANEAQAECVFSKTDFWTVFTSQKARNFNPELPPEGSQNINTKA